VVQFDDMRMVEHLLEFDFSLQLNIILRHLSLVQDLDGVEFFCVLVLSESDIALRTLT
jgi:hypothetical protein